MEDKKLEELKKARELRNKSWEELATEEKIERMREIVKNLQRENGSLLARVNKLEEHSHQNGKMVVPYRRYQGGGSEVGEMSLMPKGKVYF